MDLVDAHSNYIEKQHSDLRRFFEQYDGQDFVTVNLLKRVGHPVFFARAASDNLENIACDTDNWTAAGMVRYFKRQRKLR